ncbi:hypothetical protein J6590_080248 [Homalodisca vitripennis]|nr:hypothetical protein J6590_080248 [Homalodisca vitripennis]
MRSRRTGPQHTTTHSKRVCIRRRKRGEFLPQHGGPENRERVYPRGLSLYDSSLGPNLRTPAPGADRSNAESDLCIHGAGSWRHTRENTIGSAKPTSVPSLRQFRDTPRVLRYAPIEKKEEVTPTWGQIKEKVGEICPEKIKDVELRSERQKKDQSSRRTVRRVSQLGSGSPGVASLPEVRRGLPCSRKPTIPEDRYDTYCHTVRYDTLLFMQFK